MALPNGTDTTPDTSPVITTTRLLADLQVYGYPELKVSGTADETTINLITQEGTK